MIRKLLVGGLVGLGALVATATPAAAAGWVYTGYWYYTDAACEAAWVQMQGNNATALPHECLLDGVGVYELWAYQL